MANIYKGKDNSLSESTKPPTNHRSTIGKDIYSVKRLNRIQLQAASAAKSSDLLSESPSLTGSSSPPPLARYKPSKAFLGKCRSLLDDLLKSIEGTYHSEIKELYSDDSLTDFRIQFGDGTNKTIHRCMLAARAYKLYNTLRAFRESQSEPDIIIGEFQKNLNIVSEELVLSNSEDLLEQQFEKSSIEDQNFNCQLPDNIINPDLFLNFARRIYLDQDVFEEETKLSQRLVDWLKVHRSELVKIPVLRHSPDHKESFRTVQQDFVPEEARHIKSPTMSDQLINFTDDLENSTNEDVDEASQANSIRDESLANSLLTRTETFELISSKNNNAPNISPSISPSKNILLDSQDDDDDIAKVNHQDSSISPSAYAPTTRTGLKPKTFTTPVGNHNSLGPTGTAPSKGSRDATVKTVSKTTASSRSTIAANKQSSGTTAAKRLSLSSNHSESSTPESQSSKQTLSKTKTSATVAKNKPTLISRAHPISMERSQSPSTTVMKSSGRNFIAANKRLVSQMEKKSPALSEQMTNESEADLSETSSFLLEPLNLDNLVANLDSCSLVSLSKLADALSKMFIDNLLSDTIVRVRDGKQIEAHRCILAARSAYLADLITKQSLQVSNSELGLSNKKFIEIDLTKFSHQAVYFSLLHIYTGIVKVPEDLDIEELTELINQLHVTTLRQVCLQNLKMNYCHFFHKPCNVCCLGVLKTLPLAWRYDYTELYSNCLHWIGSNYSTIFALKEFSELKPQDLVEECYSATLSQLTPDNVIPKTIECQRLLKNLPRVKWTESVICLVGRLLEDLCHYVADNYEKILQSDSFLNLSKNCWECEILEENLLAAMNHLKPDSGCKTLIQLHKIECSNDFSCDDQRGATDSFASLVSKMRKYCERYLLKEAAAVVHCSSWRHMNPSLQKRIKDQAIISTDFDEPTKQLASKPKLASMSRTTNAKGAVSPSGDISGTRSPSNRSTPESRLKSPSTTYLPPPKNKTAAARHVKVLK